MIDDSSSIELEIDVPGTPEDVWRAIATGPGITSWYVPHEVDERQGGAATARFGPGPDMEVPGRVAAWEPPRRIVFDGGDGVGGLAFEWLVEAREGGTCIVRLVNSGFGNGDGWDDQYDAMTEGWKMFLSNLRLHLTHFPGLAATTSMPGATWSGTSEAAWARLCRELGIPAEPSVGDRLDARVADGPALGGTIADVATSRITVLLDDPAPGTALIAAEAMGDVTQVSVWSYLYGADAGVVVDRDEPRWQSWLDDFA